MSRERILEVVLTIFGAVLLLVAAVGKHPYGFYMVLRLVITVGAVYWAWRVYKTGLRVWAWAFVAVALLLNPFLPIRMQRTQWQPIDLCLGILLIGWSGYWIFSKRSRASQRQTLMSAQEGQACQWPRAGAYQKVRTSAGEKATSSGSKAASPRGTSSVKGWETDWLLFRIVWLAVCLLLGGSSFLPVSSKDSSWILIVVFVMIPAGLQAWCTDSTLYRIAWTAVCLVLGGGFSLAVSASDSGLGLIVVSAIAFGGFASAVLLWSRAIRKVLSKIGIKIFAMQALVTGSLIVCAIHALNLVGGLAVRLSTPGTQLTANVSGASAPPVQNHNNANDASGVSVASAECHPPVFSQQELSALEQQAASGDAAAQCGLGLMYAEGKGVPKDDSQAVLWVRRAAEQGNAEAQDALGALYGNGESVLQDDAEAALWFRKAAEQSDIDAQYNLGALYFEEWEGQGGSQDDTQAAFWCRKIRAWREWINSADPYNWRYTQAVFWLRKAAEQGNADAQHALGNLYYDGHGPLSMQFRYGMNGQYAQAALWFRKAAEQGDADAQYNLGLLYDDGNGVPQDYTEAYFWFDLAAAGEQNSSDSKLAAKDRDDTASHLTPADLASVQQRVRKWLAAPHQSKAQ